VGQHDLQGGGRARRVELPGSREAQLSVANGDFLDAARPSVNCGDLRVGLGYLAGTAASEGDGNAKPKGGRN
ncbi:hypothetical protein LH612_35835, partial [Klebsiella pneumoniae]|nr:hypothetical protein [Klebsiella pneumoniae]